MAPDQGMSVVTCTSFTLNRMLRMGMSAAKENIFNTADKILNKTDAHK